MPPPTSSQKPSAPAAAVAPKAKTNGTAAKAPAAPAATGEGEKRLAKPDQAKYNAEQDELNKEIAAVKTKLVSLRPDVA